MFGVEGQHGAFVTDAEYWDVHLESQSPDRVRHYIGEVSARRPRLTYHVLPVWRGVKATFDGK